MIKDIVTLQQENQTEKDWSTLNRLGKRLFIPIPQAHVRLTITRDGQIISSRRLRSHTWNRNYWNSILCHGACHPTVDDDFGAGFLSFKDVAAAVVALDPSNHAFYAIGVDADDTYGIQVGSGSGAESFEGFGLSTKIVHGTGANQLQYAAQPPNAQDYNVNLKKWTITMSRDFTNGSGSLIDVTELAIVYYNFMTTTFFTFNRDLLTTPQPVAAAEVLNVAWEISLSFPE